MWVLILLVHIGMIGIAYRQSDAPKENGLVLKLIGYLLLGMLTLTLSATPLPLGFAIYLFFFNKECVNARAKFVAALFGLLWFGVNLFI